MIAVRLLIGSIVFIVCVLAFVWMFIGEQRMDKKKHKGLY